MKKILLSILPLLLIVGCSKEPINYKTSLVKRDGVFYTNDTNELYSGKVFSLYSDGKKKDEGSIKNGELDGLWTEWYTDGQKKSEGTYKDGRRDSLWIGMYESGQQSYEETYDKGELINKQEWDIDGKVDGIYFWWYKTKEHSAVPGWVGTKKETTYKNGKKEGKHTWWYDNSNDWLSYHSASGGTKQPLVWISDKGKKMIEEGTYKDDKKDGIWNYWKNVSKHHYKWKKETYKSGKLDGLYTDWYLTDNSSNRKKSWGTYKDGKKDGLWTEWYTTHETTTTYKDGKKDGLYTTWYPENTKKVEGNYKDGKKDGEWTYRVSPRKYHYEESDYNREWKIYEEGAIERVETYKNGIMSKFTNYNKDGTVKEKKQGSYSLRFDGNDDVYKYDAVFDADGNWTISGWINTISTSTQYLLSTSWSGNQNQNTLGIRINANSGLSVWRRDNRSNELGSDNYGTISTDTWHYIAITYDGSTVTFYLDGSNIGSQSWTTGTINSTDIALGVQSRNRGNVREHYFKGKMDEVRIWNSVLSQAEIQSNMSTPPASATDLVAYWSFNDGEGLLWDLSGNGNHGMIRRTGSNFGATWSTDTPF